MALAWENVADTLRNCFITTNQQVSIGNSVTNKKSETQLNLFHWYILLTFKAPCKETCCYKRDRRNDLQISIAI